MSTTLERRRGRYTVWFRVAAVCFPFVLVALIEGASRLLLPYPPSNVGTYQVDPRFMYFHKPGSVGWEISPYGEHPPVRLAYNDYGFRGGNFAETNSAGETRVFVLGDSFVEGRQVPEAETMAAVLQRALGDRARVVNAGCSAFTTTTEFLLLKHHVARFDPDAVVLLFACNDYCDNFWYGRYCDHPSAFEKGLPAELMPTAYYSSDALHTRSLAQRVKDSSALLTWLAFRARPQAPQPQPWKEVIESSDFRSSPLRIHKRDLNAEEQTLLEFTHRGLTEMQRWCDERHVPFLVAVLPFPMQVNADENRSGKAIWGYEPDQTMTSKVYQQRLTRFCDKEGIECLDLLPAFQQSTAEGRLFLDYDGHLSPAGHALVAHEFERALLRIGAERGIAGLDGRARAR